MKKLDDLLDDFEIIPDLPSDPTDYSSPFTSSMMSSFNLNLVRATDDDDDDDEFHNTCSPVMTRSLPIDEPPPPALPVKSTETLRTLAHEVFTYLTTQGVKNSISDYFLSRAAEIGYTQLAKLSLLAGADIKVAKSTPHESIQQLVKQATPPVASHQVADSMLATHDSLSAWVRFIMPRIAHPQKSLLFQILHATKTWDAIEDSDIKKNRIPALYNEVASLVQQFNADITPAFIEFVFAENNLALWKIMMIAGMPASVESKTMEMSALHRAAWVGRTDIAQLLLDNGADVNSSKEPMANTPLMLAVLGGHIDMIHLLLARGADIYQQNASGQSPANYRNASVALALFMQHNQKGETLSKNMGRWKDEYRAYPKIKPIIQNVMDRHQSEIATWDAEGLQQLYVELTDLIHREDSSSQRQLYTTAQTFGYAEVVEVCKFLEIDTKTAPLRLSQSPKSTSPQVSGPSVSSSAKLN